MTNVSQSNAEMMTLEDLANVTGSTYRTCKKRLEAAGIQPVHRTNKSDFYPAGHAVRAIMAEDAKIASLMKNNETFAASTVFPVLFDPKGKMASTLTGFLTEHAGLSEQTANAALGLAALAATLTLNQFFGYGDPETGFDEAHTLEFIYPAGLPEIIHASIQPASEA